MKTINYNNKNISPSKVVCIGRNYVEHIEELGNEIPSSMVVFNKPNSAIDDNLYWFSESCRFEGEICFLIEAGEIEAVGFGLDLTHADIQQEMKAKGLPWERAKSFDGSAVFGDFVSICKDIEEISMKLYINDTLVQFATYELMMYKPSVMLEEISNFMRLDDGDIIMSGTPKGVATYSVDDIFVGQIYCGEQMIVESTWRVQPPKTDSQ